MLCPYCGNEMEKGIIYIDGPISCNVIYKSDADAQKKSFKERMKTNPLIWNKFVRVKDTAYHCLTCKKVITVLDEENCF